MSLTRQNFDAELIRCQPKLRAAARGLCSRQPNADDTALDVLQDANLRAIERRDQFCGGSVVGWLYVILRNVFRDHLRHLNATREHETLQADLPRAEHDDGYAPEYDDYPDADNPHSKLEATQAIETISRMSERTAGALLQAGVGATCTEIAASLSLSEANVRKLLERGRLDLRLTLALQDA